MGNMEILVSWYFSKQPNIINHLFLPIGTGDPYKAASEQIMKRYECKKEAFNILIIQECLYEQV